jgi:3-oxoacyl-[acyl-carrier-protein] synthase-1/3-oxoacyl-[acyl-carrier-protein] synthase II
VALVRDEARTSSARVRAWVTGFGASCDATHLTAPDASGSGLARAASAAVEAGTCAIDLVSAHGTATPQNDAAEAAALVSVLGSRAGGGAVPVFSLKGTTGHTLGAAGALELLAAVDALERGVAPASVGIGAIERGLHVLDRVEASSATAALKLSAAFGGANAALVVALADGERRASERAPRGEVRLSPAVNVTLADAEPARLAARTGYGADRIGRGDGLVRLSMAAVAALEDVIGGSGALRGAGIIVGHGLATIETNARFLARILEAGAARAEPRRFPYTTPNAAAGECAVAFGLTGPAFAVGGGPHGGIEAIGVAADLVRSGVVDRVVVVAVDEAGEASERVAPGTASGAVAVLVGDSRCAGAARLEDCTLRLEVGGAIPSRLPPMDAHRALLPLVSGRPSEVTAEVPWGGFAKARLFWL